MDTIYWHMNATQGAKGRTLPPGCIFAAGCKFAHEHGFSVLHTKKTNKQRFYLVCKKTIVTCQASEVVRYIFTLYGFQPLETKLSFSIYRCS